MSLQQLDTKLLDESSKLKYSVALDMNLEKSRIKEEVREKFGSNRNFPSLKLKF